MARGVGRDDSSRPALNGPNGDPPQSTLAEQLVNRFKSDTRTLALQDDDTFTQLLREVLDGDAYLNSANTPETNLDVTYRLIYVIVKAGLEVLTSDDPFTRHEKRTDQALASLKAIELTFRRSPHALFHVPSSSIDNSLEGIPLILWLLPKLLSLLSFEKSENVQNGSGSLLVNLISVEAKLHPKGVKSRCIERYLKAVVEDLFTSLEDGLLNDEKYSSPNIILPSQESIQSLFPHIETRLQGHKSVVLSVRTRFSGILLLSGLLMVMMRRTMKKGENQKLQYSASRDINWQCQSLGRVWHIALHHDGHQAYSWSTTQPLLTPLLQHLCLVSKLVTKSTSFLTTSVILIARVISDILVSMTPPLSTPLEGVLSESLLIFASLLWKYPKNSRNFEAEITQLLSGIWRDEVKLRPFGEDLKNSIALCWSVLQSMSSPASQRFAPSEIPKFDNSTLKSLCVELFGEVGPLPATDSDSRPQKRVRKSSEAPSRKNIGNYVGPLQDLSLLLGWEVSLDLAGLQERTREMCEEDQCHLFETFGVLACLTAADLEEPFPRDFKCPSCDADPVGLPARLPPQGSNALEIMQAVIRITKPPRSSLKSRKARVAAMTAISRLLSHCAHEKCLDLSVSPLAQTCLGGLSSSVREVRVAAGRILAVFLRRTVGEDLGLRNQRVALEYLRNLSDEGGLAIQETCILAWGEIARTVGDGDELCLALNKLVQYLGHRNALLCNIAFDELQMISAHSPFTAMKLFAPYWRVISITVIQDLSRRPQTAQQISDLLAMSVNDFLVLTQVHTIPHFVLRKNKDVIQRIADATRQTVIELCREHSNMAAILSHILMQASPDVEGLVVGILNSISPDFRNVDGAELLRSEPQATAAEILKTSGERDEPKRAMTHDALRFLANVTHGKPSSSRGSRRHDTLGPFFHNHVLGIMALLADTINDGKGPQPLSDKFRCLRAIREMITLAKSHVRSGLPQICACLRSAIENADLADEGFQAWIEMMESLSNDDLGPLIDPTFALLVQFWESFGPTVQNRAYDMVGNLLKSHSSTIKDVIHTLPSLEPVQLLSKYEGELKAIKDKMDVKHHFEAFCERCRSENLIVVLRALTELADYLEKEQSFLHETAHSEQPDPVVNRLTRALLDTSVLFSNSNSAIAILCARCLGMIGCLDPTRIEVIREQKDHLVLSNFSKDEDIRNFIVFFMQEVLVKSFLSATNSRNQGFLAYAMQELLAIGDFESSIRPRSREAPVDCNYYRWQNLPESMRAVLTPFLRSKYFVTAGVPQASKQYPIHTPSTSHGQWLRTLTFDLLKKNAGEAMLRQIFDVLSRIIRLQDASIANFLLPYAALNAVVEGDDQDKQDVAHEILSVLSQPLPQTTSARKNLISCSQSVFEVLDYLSRWMHEKKKELLNLKMPGTRASRIPSEADLDRDAMQISRVDAVLSRIPADIISRRAVECKSYARALFHWEQYIRQQEQGSIAADQSSNKESFYERLQDIYAQIDEPDGIEGISAHLSSLGIEQQILQDKKTGRWSAAQSWYETLLIERPDDLDLQQNLLLCLKESGQYDAVLNQIDAFGPSVHDIRTLSFAAEASWVKGRWGKLSAYLDRCQVTGDFNLGVGRSLLALHNKDTAGFEDVIENIQTMTAKNLSPTSTASLQECRESMLRFHVLSELESLSGIERQGRTENAAVLSSLKQRLEVLGPFVSDKQYILGLRRAIMQVSKRDFSKLDVAAAWMASAKLARKAGFSQQAFHAVLQASRLGDASAKIEYSRLLWNEGSHRKAIQSLEGAIMANAFQSYDSFATEESMVINESGKIQNPPKARAHLLLAKWIDKAGQTQSDAIVAQYLKAVDAHNRWERGHYHLGKHYNKILESEKNKPPSKQNQYFLSGEAAKLVIENYLRSIAFGAKYIYQTMPRVLTLWLDLGADTEKPLDPKYGNEEAFRSQTMANRRKVLNATNGAMKKYIDRLPAWAFYTALPQLVARICHPNQTVFALLVEIIAKVVMQHTAQSLWTLLAMVKSSSKDRANRGVACMTRTLDLARKSKMDTAGAELKALVSQGQKLSDQLLHVCEGDTQGKPANLSITKDLGFNHKTAPSKLAMPIEKCLTASLPTVDNRQMKQHKAFNANDYIHISAFLDDVLVLNSLQRPRKISIRGSDGHVYALLCKPKDDLRKDQRLMEFNTMINRALKKDGESSQRRLYIKTYAVTPLNEECGLIEWIDNLKTLREILLHSYKQKSVSINYSELRMQLTESISAPNKLHIFTNQIVPHFPPVFHEWFVEMFPEPGSWFTARLRYTRSCAVMSIVGHVLGLGDRHGENILFEEGNGGTFHVDFNCLFDKGLTFEKPELVPFRLTHNMVDAFGAYKCEGPFRKSCELTNRILRQHEDTLMTILETFLYDPTTDFIGKKKKQNPKVPDTPEGVLESVRNKVQGMVPGESVPLSVEGYVDLLIEEATDPFKLASMYIGWCAFF